MGKLWQSRPSCGLCGPGNRRTNLKTCCQQGPSVRSTLKRRAPRRAFTAGRKQSAFGGLQPRDGGEVLVHHRLKAVVGRHRGQRRCPRRWSRSWPQCCSWPASAPRRPVLFCGHHQHVEGRLVCLVGKTRGQLCSAATLLPCAATCPSVVARAAAVARGAIAGASALL